MGFFIYICTYIYIYKHTRTDINIHRAEKYLLIEISIKSVKIEWKYIIKKNCLCILKVFYEWW